MIRKPGFPNSNCSIKMPDGTGTKDDVVSVFDTNDENSYKKRQQLIAFGHDQWGFNNWSWGVTKQDLDFVDYANGKYNAGVVAFVSVNVKSLGIHREDVGYATCVSAQKGGAVYSARKCSVTNALRETLLSFGGDVAASLLEQLEIEKAKGQSEDVSKANNEVKGERNVNAVANNSLMEIKSNSQRKNSSDSSSSGDGKSTKIDFKSPQCQGSSSSINTSDKNNSNSNGKNAASDALNKAANLANNKISGPTANHNSMKAMQTNGGIPTGPPPMSVASMPLPMGMAPRPPVPLHPSNVLKEDNEMKMLNEEEMRAERKRRQKQKQEEFKRKLQNNAS